MFNILFWNHGMAKQGKLAYAVFYMLAYLFISLSLSNKWSLCSQKFLNKMLSIISMTYHESPKLFLTLGDQDFSFNT